MKKTLILACALGALLSCNREDIAEPTSPLSPPSVNEETIGSIPVQLRISTGIQTRGTTANDKESEIINASLTVKGISEESDTLFTDTYDVSGSANVIINLKPCDHATFTVMSGSVKDGIIQTDLAEQGTHFYAIGEISRTWDELQAEGKTHQIDLLRQVNKITIDKISVNWTNSNYDSKEFILKRIYLSDVPRYPHTSYGDVVQSIYSEGYSGDKVDFQYYNFNGLETFIHQPNNITYISDIHRLDELLLDEVNTAISKEKPYQTTHIFYSYLCNNANTIPTMKFMQAQRYAFIAPMTTVVLEAELDGTLMYYRFPIIKPNDDGTMPDSPVNTHIRFRELIITEPGAPTLYGDKTFENVNFSLVEWTDDDRTEATPNL